MIDQEYHSRETVFVHYDPRWGNFVNKHRNQFVRTEDYKLYQDGRFYNLTLDNLEEYPLKTEMLTDKDQVIKEKLEKELEKHPKFE